MAERDIGVQAHRYQYGLQLLVLTAAYYVAGRLGLLMPTRHENITLLWGASGIALAGILAFGYRVWPAIALGAFLVNTFTNVSVVAALGIAAGNTLAALAGAYWLRKVASFGGSLERVRDALAFLGLGVVASPVLSATIGVASLWLDDAALRRGGWPEFGVLWCHWWLGDAMGVLLVAPLLLVWGAQARPAWRRLQWLELAVLGVSLLLVSELAFNRRGHAGALEPFYALIPVLLILWSAIRFGARGAALATFLTVVIAVAATLEGFGPFQVGTEAERLASLHAFIGVTAVTSMLVAAVFA